ncbi:MAG: alanine racemase [Candidatus Parcubacteria bacterium]|jgi:alanine racemase
MRNTYATVSLGAIENNINVIRKTVSDKVAICDVIKADAYGHGMVPVAKALAPHVDYFAVALVAEGVTLRKDKIAVPILVLGSIDSDEIESAITYNLTITAASSDKLEEIARVGEKLGKIPTVHLKIDTGMGRVGVHWQRKEKFIDLAVDLTTKGKIICEGMYSHFSDSMDADYTKIQFERFQTAVAYADEKNLKPTFLHICSSRSIFLYPEYHLSMVRPGVAIYGIEPECESSILPSKIMPALSLTTKVTYFKVSSKGEYIGYGKTYQVQNEYERIITLPLGYADGYPRRLSNAGYVLIKGKSFPVVGRICMDQFTVSLGRDGEAYVGDVVTLIGKDGNEQISVQEIATQVGTTPHEIVTCLSARVPRIYTE